MADDTNYLRQVRQQPANNFGPLTPEQQAMLDRDKIDESLGPFDWMPGKFAMSMAGAGAGLMGSMPGGLFSVPGALIRGMPAAQVLRQNVAPAAQGAAAMGALGYGTELKYRYENRADQENKMMFGNPADAEGQPGGFYGRRR